MRDCYYERDTGIGRLKGRDSEINNHSNETRTGKSVHESFARCYITQETL